MELRILHISDTHGVHHRLRDLPEADVLVHSGDFTMNGSEAEALDFLEWLCDLPYRHKVFVAGNHDACLYGATLDGLDDNVHYLFGHIHKAHGTIDDGKTVFSNAAIMDESYDNLNAPLLLILR